MGTQAIADIYTNHGAIALIVIAFFALVVWLLKHFEKLDAKYQQIISDSAEREKNYQSIISTLSTELPAMRETLARIEKKIT